MNNKNTSHYSFAVTAGSCDDFKTTTFAVEDLTNDLFLPVGSNYHHHQKKQPSAEYNQVVVGSKNDLIIKKSLQEEYHNYSGCILWLKLHGMITAFFMLWSLASKSIPQELLATKFMHVLAPFLTLHWWHLSNYPIHLYLLLTMDNGDQQQQQQKQKQETNLDAFSKRMELRIYEGTFFSMLLYFTLVLIDILYFCIKLVPLANTCFTGTNSGSGNSLPPECDSSYDENDPNSHNRLLFVISFVIALIHIVFGITVIGVIFKTRNRVHKSKIL